MKENIIVFAIIFVGIITALRHIEPGYQLKENGERKFIKKIEKMSAPCANNALIKKISYFKNKEDLNKWEAANKIQPEEGCEMQIYWNTPEEAQLVLVEFANGWDSYRNLVFDIYNPNSENISFEIWLVDNFTESRLSKENRNVIREYSLKNGMNTVSLAVPELAEKTRIMTGKQVVKVEFYAYESIFYIDNMRLER